MGSDKKGSVTFAIIIAGLVAIFWFLDRGQKKSVAAIVEPAPQDAFAAAYSPGYTTDWATKGFQSTININLPNPGLGMLNSSYIPVFGLVGMTAIGDM